MEVRSLERDSLFNHLEGSLLEDSNGRYTLSQGITGGRSDMVGHTYLKLESSNELAVDSETLEGYPTVIVVLFKPGSRIRDMFNARYTGINQISVKEFVQWLKSIIQIKVNLEGADIKMNVKPVQFGSNIKTEWSVFVHQE